MAVVAKRPEMKAVYKPGPAVNKLLIMKDANGDTNVVRWMLVSFKSKLDNCILYVHNVKTIHFPNWHYVKNFKCHI